MQKKRVRKSYVKNAAASNDRTLTEFEKNDLGSDVETAGTAVVVRPQKPTSMLIGEDLIAMLKVKAAKRGIPYQTMMKIIVREHIDDY